MLARVALACGALALAGCGASDHVPAPRTAQLRYAVIGDSYSNGEAVGRDRAWPVLLAGRLRLDLVVNAAVTGWTTEQALEQELPAFRAAHPDVATLQIGTNDLVQRVPAATFRARFARLLAAMVRTVGGARRVVVVTLPDFSVKPVTAPSGDRPAISRALRARNAIVRAESRAQHVAVADVFAVSRRPTDPSPDGLHPSVRELRAWTDAIVPVARRAWAGLHAR